MAESGTVDKLHSERSGPENLDQQSAPSPSRAPASPDIPVGLTEDEILEAEVSTLFTILTSYADSSYTSPQTQTPTPHMAIETTSRIQYILRH